MTANQMATRVEEELDRVSNFSSPGYLDNELSDIITKAQWLTVKKILSYKTNLKREGFEETEVRKQGLSELIEDSSDTASTGTNVSVSQSGVLTNGVFYDLPVNFMGTIMEECVTNVVDCTDISKFLTASVAVITHDEYRRYVNNEYRKPYALDNEAIVWRMQYKRQITGFDNTAQATQTDKRHELLTDGTFNITNYRIRYLKIPENIVIDRTTTTNQRHCELDESVQETIIDTAVDLLKEITDRQDIKNVEPINTLE